MKFFLPVCAVAAVSALFSSCPTRATAADASRPNIVFIYADDLGYGETGPYGQKKIHTPNLDKLAAEGIKLTQHYTAAPVCAAARCMMLTGQHSGHAYIRGNYELGGFADDKEGGQMPLPPHEITIGTMLQGQGYKTGAFGKWGLGEVNTTGRPDLQGFDEFFGYLCQKQAHNYYPTHLWHNSTWVPLNNKFINVNQKIPKGTTDPAVYAKFRGNDYSIDKISSAALEFIDQNKSRPFFLYMPLTLPHLSLQVPPAALAEYKGKFPEEPFYGKYYTPTLYPRATYAAMITYLDTEVGNVMNELEKNGLASNTLFIFSSDNGPTFKIGGFEPTFFNSSGGFRGGKTDVYEGGIREPFIARWPGHIKPGTVSNFPTVQYDILATFADLLNIKNPPLNDGISFLPLLLGHTDQQKKHDFFYWEFPEKGGQLAVRIGDWKGVKQGLRKNEDAPWELYDLSSDQKETNDVASKHSDILKKMDAIVKREHVCPHIREWEIIDPKFDPYLVAPRHKPKKKAPANA